MALFLGLAHNPSFKAASLRTRAWLQAPGLLPSASSAAWAGPGPALGAKLAPQPPCSRRTRTISRLRSCSGKAGAIQPGPVNHAGVAGRRQGQPGSCCLTTGAALTPMNAIAGNGGQERLRPLQGQAGLKRSLTTAAAARRRATP